MPAEQRAITRQAVEYRRVNFRARGTDIGKAHVVDQDEHDIGFLRRHGCDSERVTDTVSRKIRGLEWELRVALSIDPISR